MIKFSILQGEAIDRGKSAVLFSFRRCVCALLNIWQEEAPEFDVPVFSFSLVPILCLRQLKQKSCVVISFFFEFYGYLSLDCGKKNAHQEIPGAYCISTHITVVFLSPLCGVLI